MFMLPFWWSPVPFYWTVEPLNLSFYFIFLNFCTENDTTMYSTYIINRLQRLCIYRLVSLFAIYCISAIVDSSRYGYDLVIFLSLETLLLLLIVSFRKAGENCILFPLFHCLIIHIINVLFYQILLTSATITQVSQRFCPSSKIL